ncbi:MAG: RNA polymerase sigma factor [bacterium]|nr:RNA polymerase sigma factor [bacterium]
MQTTTFLPGPCRHVPAAQDRIPETIARALARRGVAMTRPDETAESRVRRLETELMALFQETRTNRVFEVLYELSSSSLAAWILHLVAGRPRSGDPQELLQDTFVNIYRYAGSFRTGGGRTFRCWARTIAANVVRRARVRTAALPMQPLPEGGLEPADLRLGPVRSLSSEEQSERLRKAWMLLLLHYAAAYRKLSDRDREAMRLVEVEGLSYDEAGELLKVGRSNMKMIMFRSRKRLRAHVLEAMRSHDERGDLRLAI